MKTNHSSAAVAKVSKAEASGKIAPKSLLKELQELAEVLPGARPESVEEADPTDRFDNMPV